MDTPICDFVGQYMKSSPLRLHMPGHKGSNVLGIESLDITEVHGADSLFHACGVIYQSEANASKLFGCHTLYSTEGSSLCIRAMLYLCILYAKAQGRKPLIAAARNVHTTFISAAALLDFQIQWLLAENTGSYLSCQITEEQLTRQLEAMDDKPVAVYITSPDYLGNMSDIRGLSQICRKHGVLLVVDNAHGAYLRFLTPSRHPVDLGADLCCDSAHKTLPVLTGGAYLHISNNLPEMLHRQAKRAMSLFASTSPSYLILQSLDAANPSLVKDFGKQLTAFIDEANQCRKRLEKRGYCFIGDEPLKWTIDCKVNGYTGNELAQLFRNHNIEPEFSDPDYLVLMLTPQIGSDGLCRLTNLLDEIPALSPIGGVAPIPNMGEKALSIREAMMNNSMEVPVNQSLGKILASPSVGCPPAVPILVCGERIDQRAIDCFLYYGIEHCCVVNDE